MSKGGIESVYPLTPMEEGMLFHSLLDPAGAAYVVQFQCDLAGAVDRAAFRTAWERVLARHPALRSAFVHRGVRDPVRVVHARLALPFRFVDLLDLPSEERDARLDALAARERQEGIDPARAPLMRLVLFRTGPARHRFLWTHHHLLFDGWSLPRVFRDVLAFYDAGVRNETPALPPLPAYRSYLDWLKRRDEGAARAYWQETLRGLQAPTPLPAGRLGGALRGEEADARSGLDLRLTEEETTRLEHFARSHRLTPATLVQGAWALLLARHGGGDEAVFGVTVSGRPAGLGMEDAVGLFINTLPVRIPVRPELPVAEWLAGLQRREARRRDFEHSSLVDIHGWSELPRGTPLFESLVVFENYPMEAAVRDRLSGDGRLRVEAIRSREGTNYPLTLAGAPGERMRLSLLWDADRYDGADADRLLTRFRTLLLGLLTGDGSVGDVSLLQGPERARIIYDWGDGGPALRPPACLHVLFEAQVDRAPDAPAVRSGDRTLTYHELDERANQLAHTLRAHGVGRDGVVALCLQRSPELVVAMLAAQKAGGAYLPLDPDHPAERLGFMMGDAGVRVLVTDAAHRTRLPAWTGPVALVDEDGAEIAARPASRLDGASRPEDLAYVIYTSGSTGRPKGVTVEHRSVLNFLEAGSRVVSMGPGSRVLQFFSPVFDGAVMDIFGTLIHGGELILAPEGVLKDPEALVAVLREEAVTTILMPPSYLAVLPSEDLPALTSVLSAGEALPWEVAEQWGPGRRLVNAYGPTEASIAATVHDVTGRVPGCDTVPIGRPLPNVRVRVLDTHGALVPGGVPGELYIGGGGVARGYVGRADLTAERFVPDPFRADERLYRTGDRVRWLPNGALEFLGRTDDQVKLRGFRIETGEVRAALLALDGVRYAAVMLRDDGAGPYLAAYVVPDGEAADLEPGVLRQALAARLPAPMVPAVVVVLDALPMLASGKVDLRALPAPEPATRAADDEAPRTPAEDLLATLMAEVLGCGEVGRTQSFFDLGGHSLLATRFVSRIREAFAVELPLAALFEAPTVAALAPRVEAARGERSLLPPVEAADHEGDARPLSFAQQRLWFLERLAGGGGLYAIPLAVRLEGPLDPDALAWALAGLQARHEVLRTTFHDLDGEPVARVLNPEDVALPVEDLSTLPPGDREAVVKARASEEARRPFDLEAGPLVRACLLRLDETTHVALLTIHHLVIDGGSMPILVRELGALYATRRAGQSAGSLPALPVQYGDYAAWQRRVMSGERLEADMAYWRERLAGLSPRLELPTDRPRPAVQRYRGGTEPFVLDAELADALRAMARREGATLFMTLMAAWQVLLGRTSGQDDVCVGTPVAHRPRPELEGLIGLFANTVALRSDLSGEPTFRAVLRQVRTRSLEAFRHADVPFERVVEAVRPGRSLTHSPLFQVMLVLQDGEAVPDRFADLQARALETGSGVARFDLTLQLSGREGGHLAGALEYSRDLFDSATVRRLLAHFRILLEAVTTAPEVSIARLPLLTPEEEAEIAAWAGPEAAEPRARTLGELVTAQACETPNAPAVRFGAEMLTYAELDARANRLARHLQACGVGPEAVVGLGLERSLDLPVGLLAISRAGGAWLPLDPTGPAERLAFMLRDAGVSLLLTSASRAGVWPAEGLDVLCVDEGGEVWAEEAPTPPETGAGPESLAYVIYTSGSTGRPKGVELEHRGLVNLATVLRRRLGLGPGDRVLQFSALSFDASAWEMVMAFGSGACLVLAPAERLRDPAALARLLAEERITAATLPPSMLALLDATGVSDLRVLVSAGEACPAAVAERWAPGRRFLNAYGPTETTVCACWAEVDGTPDAGPPPIGRALENVQLHVLDAGGERVPVGVPGELRVGGVQVARGYRGRPDLTEERFLADRFRRVPGARLYRTGDRVRWRPDGRLDYLGRMDQQVKVRGFRIEPGEVEAALRAVPGVDDAVVVAAGDQLVAWLLRPGRDGDEPLDGAMLRRVLEARLPDYMVPGRFVEVASWPTTPNGKVDRKALTELGGERVGTGAAHVEPRTGTEARLAALVADLLDVPSVGVLDDFFDLGGHSLLATRLVSRMREAFGVEIELRTLFEHPTVAALAERIEAARGEPEARPDEPELRAVDRSAYRRTKTKVPE